MGLPRQVKREPHHSAQQMMRKARVLQGRTNAPTRCHGPPGPPLSPAAGMHQPSSPCAEGDFLGTAGCKGHCCPLLVQGQGERGQPGSPPPGPGTPAGGDTAVPCCHTCAESARAQPGCHRLSKLVLLDPPCRLRACLVPGYDISHVRVFR